MLGEGNFQRSSQLKVENTWTSLVVHWIRIYLPLQGTRVQFLVWEDPTWCGHLSLSVTTTEPTQSRAHTLQQEKPP